MRNHYRLLVAGLLGVVSIGACQDRAQEVEDLPSVPSAFPELLFPPGGRLVARAGSEDALQLIFRAPFPPDTVAARYRTRLSTPPWALVSDTREGTTTTLYAENAGRPVWVRILPGDAGDSRVELNGAVLSDSAMRRAESLAPRPADPPTVQPGQLRRNDSL
jgi:hypothetical protein